VKGATLPEKARDAAKTIHLIEKQTDLCLLILDCRVLTAMAAVTAYVLAQEFASHGACGQEIVITFEADPFGEVAGDFESGRAGHGVSVLSVSWWVSLRMELVCWEFELIVDETDGFHAVGGGVSIFVRLDNDISA